MSVHGWPELHHEIPISKKKKKKEKKHTSIIKTVTTNRPEEMAQQINAPVSNPGQT